MIELFHPYVPQDAISSVSDILKTKFLTEGHKVKEFEKKFADMFHVKHCVSVNSGTSALEIAYDLIGIGPGDEVITTPFTCTATNIPLLARGAKIVWADVLESNMCIDPLDVRFKMTTKTKAIVQVHVGGIRADCGIQHIPVVSDAAQALGIFNGDYTCNSFQAIKHITTGDGGMVVCPDQESDHQARLLRWFGIDRDKRTPNNYKTYKTRKMTFDIEIIGGKKHMNNIAATMGIAGLDHYEYVLNYRKNLFELYKKELKDCIGLRIMDGVQNVYWLCGIIAEDRDELAKKLFEADIDTNVVQVRNDIYKIFGGQRQDLPNMNMLEDKYLYLPLGKHITEEDVYYICSEIKKGW